MMFMLDVVANILVLLIMLFWLGFYLFSACMLMLIGTILTVKFVNYILEVIQWSEK
jgi:hypothetical protein